MLRAQIVAFITCVTVLIPSLVMSEYQLSQNSSGSRGSEEDVPSSSQLVFSGPTEVNPKGKNPKGSQSVQHFDYNGDGVFDLLHGGKDVSASINKGTNQNPEYEKPFPILAGGQVILNIGCL